MDLPPEAGSPQKNPKRIRLVFDVSGSMYRFNGFDKRLQRSLETALLVMEALEGKEEKIKYDIVGHSGDGPNHPFVSSNCPPKNEKERLNVLRKMLAHTQAHFFSEFDIFSSAQVATTLLRPWRWPTLNCRKKPRPTSASL